MEIFEKHQASPYGLTVGFSIAAVLIFLIAMLHIWKYLFKKLRKWWNPPTQMEGPVMPEISVQHHGDRKVSSTCTHQLEMFLKYEDEVSGINFTHKERNCNIKGFKKSSMKQQRFSTPSPQPEVEKITFFAGYSHRHINDA